MACTALAACELPADPNGTLNGVRGGTMRIGVAESPPWVRTSTGEPSGVEPNLLRDFAQTLSARVEWIRRGETDSLPHFKPARWTWCLAG